MGPFEKTNEKSIIFITGGFRTGGFERRLKSFVEWIDREHSSLDFNIMYQSGSGMNRPAISSRRLRWWPSHYFQRMHISALEGILTYLRIRAISSHRQVNIFCAHQSILVRLVRNRFISNDPYIRLFFGIVNNLEQSPYKTEVFDGLTKCDGLIFNSEKNQAKISTRHQEIRTYFVPNYFQPEKEECTINNFDASKLNIVSCGSLDKQKNFEALIKMIPEITCKRPDAHFTIFGNGHLKEELICLAKNLGVSNLTFVSGEDFKKYAKNYDVFLMTSLYEGYPNALLEAQIAGIPSVAFDVEFGPNEVIKNEFSGMLVKNNDLNGFANAVLRVSNALDRFRKNAAIHAHFLTEKHSNTKVMAKMLSIIRGA